MTRSELIEGLARPWGESLYNTLTELGVDLRHAVCTPSDVWALTSRQEVEGWIELHLQFDADGNLVRVNLMGR